MKSKNGFNFKELLIVIFAIAFLFLVLFFLIPYLKRYKNIRCSSQLRAVAHGLHYYQADFGGHNPITWDSKKVTKAGFGTGWYNTDENITYQRWCDPTFKDWDTYPTIGGCIYLLVKYEDVQPGKLVCPLASNDEDMDLDVAVTQCKKNGWTIPNDFTDLNDFYSGRNLSYSMNDPFENPMTDSSAGEMAFLADKSNKFDTETFIERPYTGTGPNYGVASYWTDEGDKSRTDEGHGNSNNHGTKEQSVLFMDEHVERFEIPTVGIKGDNIYTRWDDSVSPVDKQIGKWGKRIFSVHKTDAYLGN